MRRPVVMAAAAGAVLVVLAACGGEPADEAQRGPSTPPSTSTPATPTPDTSESPAPPLEPTPEPTEADRLNVEDLLVQRAGNWRQEEPDVPGEPAFSTAPDCSRLVGRLFEGATSESTSSESTSSESTSSESTSSESTSSASGSTSTSSAPAASVGWFDPKTNAVADSNQIVRDYGTPAAAEAAMADLRARVAGCGAWREGNEAPGSWRYEVTRWKAAGLPRTALAWRSQVRFVGIKDTDASTWYITARYGQVVTTVASTALDDSIAAAQQDVRRYADQAGRLILKAQDR